MPAGNLTPALEAASPSQHGRRRAPLFIVLPVVGAVTVFLAFIARFFQDLPPPPPASSIIVRVPLGLDSVPPGARISADGHDLGVTPLRSSLPVGVHLIELERDGFAKLRRRIELVPGSPLAVEFPLTPVPGSLRVITDVEKAEVLLDGKPLSGSEGQFDADAVAPGKHKVTISGEKGHGSLTFEMKAAEPPVVEPANAGNLTMAAISRFGDSGTVISNETVKVGLTHGPTVVAGPQPAPLPVEPGQNAELLTTGLARRPVPVTHAEVPSVTVVAASQSGSLVVITGRDGASVWINDKMSRRQTKNGKLYFWSLMPGEYTIRVGSVEVPEKSAKVTVEKDKQATAELLLGAPPVKAAVVSRPPKPVEKRQASAPEPPKPVQKKQPVITAAAPPKQKPIATPAPVQKPVVEGTARFIVRTPGARVTIRRVDVPDPLTRVIVTDSLRLPAGRWMVNATAPGFQPYTAYFLVNPAGPADVFVRLSPEHAGKKK